MVATLALIKLVRLGCAGLEFAGRSGEKIVGLGSWFVLTSVNPPQAVAYY